MSARMAIKNNVGLVVDFVGVLHDLKNALQFDSADIGKGND